MGAARAFALASALLASSCWGYASDIDLVAGAAIEAPALADGIYCPVTIYSDWTDISALDCQRLAWDAARSRHYRTPVNVYGDSERDWPRALPFMDGFGARSSWLDVAALSDGLLLVQLEGFDGAETGRGLAAPDGYVAFVVCPSDSGFALLPLPDARALEALAAGGGVMLETFEVDGETGPRIAAGEPAAARALVRDAAATWLELRRATGRGFRPAPADSDEVSPVFHVRLEALREDLPLEVALQAVLFEVEQQLRAAAMVE